MDYFNEPIILPSKTRLETCEYWIKWIKVLRNYAKDQDIWDTIDLDKPELTTDILNEPIAPTIDLCLAQYKENGLKADYDISPYNYFSMKTQSYSIELSTFRRKD